MQRRGQLTIVLDGRTTEHDTLTCAHCNFPFVMPPKPAPPTGGFCRLCMAAVCDKCVGDACTPFEKKMDRMEKRTESRRRLAGVGVDR